LDCGVEGVLAVLRDGRDMAAFAHGALAAVCAMMPARRLALVSGKSISGTANTGSAVGTSPPDVAVSIDAFLVVADDDRLDGLAVSQNELTNVLRLP
jgi:hypothetical protein